MMRFVAIAAWVPSLMVLLAVPHAAKARRLARLVRAQQEWAEQMDRLAEQSRPAPVLPCPARKGRFRVKPEWHFLVCN